MHSWSASAAVSPQIPSSALPGYQGAFIGRRALLPELERAVVSGVRVALVGPPGAGKSRLAVELAHRPIPRPVLEIALGGVRDREGLLEAIAGGLRIESLPRSPEGLGAWIEAFRPAWLLFDGAEGLDDDAVDLLAQILAAARASARCARRSARSRFRAVRRVRSIR